MKKFKIITRFNMIILSLMVLSIIGCQKNNRLANDSGDKGILVYITGTTTGFDVSNPLILKDLVKQLADEKGEITILDAGIKEFRDNLGLFKAVSAKYRSGDEVTRMVVPLSESNVAAEGNGQDNVLMLADDGCEMKCTSAWGCSSCEQTIIERCKKQICTCTSKDGGCSSKITFPPPPPPQN